LPQRSREPPNDRDELERLIRNNFGIRWTVRQQERVSDNIGR
jgi:hypothetical protein